MKWLPLERSCAWSRQCIQNQAGKLSEYASCVGADREFGPLITLSGEADITTAAQLGELTTAQLAAGTQHVTVDAAELAFADSMAIHVLLVAARMMDCRALRRSCQEALQSFIEDLSSATQT